VKLSKQEKRLLSILVALAIFACYYLFIYRPMIGDIETMTLDANIMSERLNTAQTNEKRLPDLKRQLDELEKEIQSSFDEIPEIAGEQELVVYLYKTLQPLARKTSLVIGSSEEGTQYNGTVFNISFETSYQNFKRILKLLESSKGNNIVSFTINNIPANQDNENDNLHYEKDYNIIVNMSIEFFYRLHRGQEIEGYPYIKGTMGTTDPFRDK